MSQRKLLLITHSGLHIYSPNRTMFVEEVFFAAHAEGHQQFSDYLAKTSAVYTLLADLADESFHSEQLPRLGRADQHALLKRKLSQHFLNPRFATHFQLGTRSVQRHEQQFIFAGLNQHEQIEPWMHILQQHKTCITGLYTPALLAAELIKTHFPRQQTGLLISLTPAGIHQVFLQSGVPRFARLSTPPVGDYDTWHTQCYSEAYKAWQYIVSQRWATRDEEIPVWFLLHPQDFAVFYRNTSGSTFETQFHQPTLNYRFLDLSAIGLHYKHGDSTIRHKSSNALPLFMQIALQTKSAKQYASEQDRTHEQIRVMRQRIYISGLAGLSACILMSLAMQFKTQQLQNLIKEQTALKEQTIQRNQAALQQNGPYAISLPTHLQHLVQRVNQFKSLITSPAPPLYDLSSALDQDPAIQIEQIEWRLKDWRTSAQTAGIKPIVYAAVATTNTVPTGQAVHHELNINAKLSIPGETNPRSRIERINQFAGLIKNHSQGEIEISRLPMTFESAETNFVLHVKKPVLPANPSLPSVP